jgi:thiol:disulfide interchange protein DsbD
MWVNRCSAHNAGALLLAFFLAGLWGGFTSETARAQDDPFAQPAKPTGKSSVASAPDSLESNKRIDFLVSVTPKEAKRGETVRLSITGMPRPGFHTYPLTQRANNSFQDEIGLSKIIFDNSPGLQPLWPVTESDPSLKQEEVVGYLLEHENPFTWSQDILILPGAAPGPKTVKFRIHLQVCDKTCVWEDHDFERVIQVSSAPPVPLTPELKSRMEAKKPDILIKPVPAIPAINPAPTPTPGPASHDNSSADATISMADRPEDHQADLEKLIPQIKGTVQSSSGGLLAFILAGIFWGAVSLITPCVFPMIPITVSYFLKQSEKEHHRPLAMAAVYSLTIVIVLTIAAMVLLETLKQLSINPLMNFGLGALFVFFALSLFGMYEIELPSGLARFTSTREGKGGLLGTTFMALTFTIISFACVAPFLGGFAGTAATSGLTWYHRLLGGLAFSVTFAAPFFLLALFPTLLRKLPKSGAWLNSVKVVMGFLELAAALKFFRAGELVLIPKPTLFTYDLVLGMWIALAFLCGLYLLNFYRLPHDTPADHIGVARLLIGFLFLSLSFYLLPALFKFGSDGEKQRPNGSIYAWVNSFLLPEPGEKKGELPWSGNLAQSIEEARIQRQLVFVDFTGQTCTNCKINEENVFSKPEFKELFRPYRLVQLYTDKVPDKYYSASVRGKFGNDASRQRKDATVNLKFQKDAFGTEQLPLYVILQPKSDGTIQVVGQYTEGKINDETSFAQFLKQPLNPQDSALRAQLAGKLR